MIIPSSLMLIVAFNFSYFVFKKKRELVNYFKQALKGLDKQGGPLS